MARYTGPKCRLCRRERMRLFLKGTRCDSVKCPVGSGRRDYPPGVNSWRRSKVSDYALQLREKQKVKRFYGILDRQFRKYFNEAVRMRGNTGENLLLLLERRLDNAVLLLGFGKSRSDARQIVRHGHVLVNGRRTDIPSYQLKVGDEIAVRGDDGVRKMIQDNVEIAKGRDVPSWLEFDAAGLAGKTGKLPSREEVSVPVREQLIVEFMSR